MADGNRPTRDRVPLGLLSVLMRLALASTAVAWCAWLAGPGTLLATPAQARRSQSPRAQVVRALAPVAALTRELPRTVAPAARRRDRRQAKLALAAARRGDFCAVAAAIAQIDRAGRVRTQLTVVSRVLQRRRLTAGCVDRGAKLPRIAAHAVDGGGVAPPELSRPREHEQGDVPPLPIGPHRSRPGGRPAAAVEDAVGAPAPGASGARASRTPTLKAFSAALTDPVSIFTRGDVPTPTSNLAPLDPSSATSGDVVLVTGNRYLSVSTDGGRTFTSKDPRDIYATATPAALRDPDGGACCDQVVHYDPRTDRFYWLLQYWCTVQQDCLKRPGENRVRLAVASPKDVAESGGTRWRFWDVTSRDLGLSGDWLDFPDMAVGRDYLYVTVNSPPTRSAVWARLSTRKLRDGTLDGWYHRYAGEYLLKPVQDARSSFRGWVVRRSSTSELELKGWGRSTDTRSWTIPLATTATQDCAVVSPDGLDALSGKDPQVAFRCGGQSSQISGAALQSDRSYPRIWVAWTAGRREEGTKDANGSDRLDGPPSGFPQPHVELAVINASTRKLEEQPAVWSRTTAYAYPYLAGGPSGEVAMSYMAAAPGQYPGWGVGLITNRVSLARVATGTQGAARVGDYLAVRPAWPSRVLFAATGNVLDATTGFAPKYALFGRRGDRPLPARPARPSPIPLPTPTPTPAPAPPPAPAPSTLPTGNLIADPDAEQGPAADDATQAFAPSSWAQDGPTPVHYGATGGFPDLATGRAVGGATAFFAGGPAIVLRADPPRRTMSQTIDLGAAAAEIDAGGVRATLSALLGGFGAQEDAATIRADFGDGANRPVLLSLTAGPVSAGDRSNVTTLLARSASGVLPAGVRRVRVEVDFDRASPPGTYDDAYADNLSLTLQPAVR